ncbi:MAG: ribonuclease E/G [Lachnospiraceae bacterium]|nr:ribonuclease E/G [Lachnospiraceae bacterium]
MKQLEPNGKLILTEYTFGKQTRDIAFFLKDNRMEYLKILPREDALLVGTILIGKCRHQVPNIPAAFFALNQEGDIGFLSTKNTEHLKVLNREFKGKLADGDEVLLQVRREPVKTKEYAVSGNVELQGRFCVAGFGSGRLFFSRNHKDSVKDVISSYLRQKALCAPDLSLIGYSGYDLILRTRAEKMTDSAEHMEALYRDCADTLAALEQMVSQAVNRSCFSILEKPASWLDSVREDLLSCGFQVTEYITDSYRLYTSLQENVLKQDSQIRYYQDNQVSLPVLYNISARIEEALGTKVWLKSGGYLCIEQTEAMTVVDVNTGKATRGKNSEKVFFETNMEAAAEVLRQLRLRNITGIIVIDFINMADKSHEESILNAMKELAVHDYQKVHIYEFTKLGLLELTREKRGKSLQESIK